jgi:pimeloyl-ACP methyl ester carboxylesterase
MHDDPPVQRIETPDGLSLALRVEGSGTPVVLLHGFPDSSYVWRNQIPVLVESGFRVVAPDLRGLGESDKPQEVERYRMTTIAKDVVAILDHLGLGRAHVVGHDFGANLAWVVAGLHPERVDRLVAMSVGHPNTQREPTVDQREKAWYMLWFQFEGLAEEVVPRHDWKLLREWTRGNGDVDRYIGAFSRPGAMRAGLNWYRANVLPLREAAPARDFPSIAAPTLGLWSSGDDYLTEGPIRGSGEYVTGPWRYERIEEASHWLQLDRPDRVNELLLEFLSG